MRLEYANNLLQLPPRRSGNARVESAVRPEEERCAAPSVVRVFPFRSGDGGERDGGPDRASTEAAD